MLSKVYEVFTKDYKEEAEFRGFIRGKLKHFKKTVMKLLKG